MSKTTDYGQFDGTHQTCNEIRKFGEGDYRCSLRDFCPIEDTSGKCLCPDEQLASAKSQLPRNFVAVERCATMNKCPECGTSIKQRDIIGVTDDHIPGSRGCKGRRVITLESRVRQLESELAKVKKRDDTAVSWSVHRLTTIEKILRRDNVYRYGVRWNGYLLNRSGEWDYDPTNPQNATIKWIDSHSWSTWEKAHDALVKSGASK